MNLFARLAQAKGNYAGGPPQATPRNTPRPERSQAKPKATTRPRRPSNSNQTDGPGRSPEQEEFDEDDLPLDRVCTPPRGGRKHGRTPGEDGVQRESKAARTGAGSKVSVLDDDDDMPQEDKTTVDRFEKLIDEFKELQAPDTADDGHFSQWVKDCSGHPIDCECVEIGLSVSLSLKSQV